MTKTTEVNDLRNKSSPSKEFPTKQKSEKTETGKPEAGTSVVVDQNGGGSTMVKPHEQQQNESIRSRSSETTPSKRKADEGPASESRKRRKKDKEKVDSSTPSQHTIRKLAPPRPFPTVPTSVSATAPRSAHVEGKNRICVTRKTALGMYLRRCKDVVLKDGYKILYLSAMGAAIPHLARLVVSLPLILPFSPTDIQTDIRTGTTEVHDEIVPEDEDEDITLRTRGKSTMSVTIKIEGGDEGAILRPGVNEKGKGKTKTVTGLPSEDAQPEQLVFSERDVQDNDEES